ERGREAHADGAAGRVDGEVGRGLDGDLRGVDLTERFVGREDHPAARACGGGLRILLDLGRAGPLREAGSGGGTADHDERAERDRDAARVAAAPARDTGTATGVSTHTDPSARRPW